MTKAARLVAFCSLLSMTAGCEERSDTPTDSPDPLVAREVLTIGSINDGPEAFGRISGLIEDATGRIYVADHQASDIRVFAPDGQYVYSFGGEGAGPGELSGPCCLAWAPDSSLWIRDGGNQRYSGFRVEDSSAAFLASIGMVHGDNSYSAPVTFTPEGDLVDVGHRRTANGDRELIRFVIDSNGEVTEAGALTRASVEALGGHTVTRSIPQGQARYYFYQPYSARDLVTHGPHGKWAHGISSAYEITLWQGDSTRQIVGEAASPRLSSEERESAIRRMEDDAARAGLSIDRLPYGVPESKPPLQAIFFDASGRLWVELSQADGLPRVADVWHSDGTLAQRVQWPGDIALAQPGWVGEHSALGVRRDSLGVEYVVRLTF